MLECSKYVMGGFNVVNTGVLRPPSGHKLSMPFLNLNCVLRNFETGQLSLKIHVIPIILNI